MDGLTGLRDWVEYLGNEAKPQRIAEIAALKAGDSIQISRNRESFWVEIEGVDGDEIHGSVLNTLISDGNEDIKRGDLIAFRRCNVGLIDPGGDWNLQFGLTQGVYDLYDKMREHYPERSREWFVAALHKAADEVVRISDGMQRVEAERRRRLPFDCAVCGASLPPDAVRCGEQRFCGRHAPSSPAA